MRVPSIQPLRGCMLAAFQRLSRATKAVTPFAASGLLWCGIISAQTAPDSVSTHVEIGDSACSDCHDNPHGIEPKANLSCNSCHTQQKWKAPLPFDHSRPPFRLEGAHQELAGSLSCLNCHRASAQGSEAPLFSGVSVQCYLCHTEEPHGGQFSTAGTQHEDCSSCHTPKAWSARIFDHNQTRFTLSGAHREIACADCHKQQEVNGKLIRLYRGTPTECLKCH
jgi:hypothetical protein